MSPIGTGLVPGEIRIYRSTIIRDASVANSESLDVLANRHDHPYNLMAWN